MAKKAPVTPPAGQASQTYIALLRGINVGGRRRVPMDQLIRIFTAAGCSSVRTYIQSGNVVFDAAPELAAVVPALVTDAIRTELAIAVPVVVRPRDALASVVACNPFVGADADLESLHVAFLDREPPADRVAALDPARSPGDAFAVRGGEIYLHLPNGVARTRLTSAYLDSTLGVVTTVRNWRTVVKLLALAQESR